MNSNIEIHQKSFGSFGPSSFCCKEENQRLFLLNVCPNLNFSIGIWMEEIKVRFKEELYFENRSISQLKTSSASSDIMILMQESKKNLSIESSSTTVELPIDTLIWETKLVPTQNIKFDDLVESSKSVFGTLVQSRFWWKEHNPLLFIQLICDNSKRIDWDLEGKMSSL